MIYRKLSVQIVSKTSLVDIQTELISTLRKLFQTLAHFTSPEFQEEHLPYLALGFLGLLKHVVYQGQYITNFSQN